MKSIRQATSRLPQEFIDRLYELFGTHQAEKILRGLSADRYTTLRVNTLKVGVQECMSRLSDLGFKMEKVPWNPTALIIKNKKEKDLEATDLYQSGSIYLQSLSSQIPPLALNPKPGQRIADLTSAPGGKTTQMAAMMNNKGYILATEVNAIRAERLAYNVQRQGASIVESRCADGLSVGRELPEGFDGVLLDAPCSGEGLFVPGIPSTSRYWSMKEVKKLSSDQRRLMVSAVEALKPGGTLLYSTCTMSPEENEAVVTNCLSRFPGILKVEPLDLKIPNTIPGILEFKGNRYHPDVAKAIRVLPSELLEGFFVCKFTKLRSCLAERPEDNA